MKKALKGEDPAMLSSSKTSSRLPLGRVVPSSVTLTACFGKFPEHTFRKASPTSWSKHGEWKTSTIKRQISTMSFRVVAVKSAPKQERNKCFSPVLEKSGTVFDSRAITWLLHMYRMTGSVSDGGLAEDQQRGVYQSPGTVSDNDLGCAESFQQPMPTNSAYSVVECVEPIRYVFHTRLFWQEITRRDARVLLLPRSWSN